MFKDTVHQYHPCTSEIIVAICLAIIFHLISSLVETKVNIIQSWMFFKTSQTEFGQQMRCGVLSAYLSLNRV